MGWKDVERTFAKIFATERKSKTGLGENIPDICVDVKLTNKKKSLAIEVKLRKKVPEYLLDMLKQAQNNAGGALPVVVLKQKFQRYSDSIVMLRFADFIEFFDMEDEDV